MLERTGIDAFIGSVLCKGDLLVDPDLQFFHWAASVV
jgi:hypothetical protein